MRRRRRGIFIIDALFGLVLVGMLMAVLSVAISSQGQGAAAMAEHRELVRLVERAIIALETDEPMPNADDPTTRITWTLLPHALPGDHVSDDRTWARVTVERGDHVQSLTALVPRQAAAGYAEGAP